MPVFLDLNNFHPLSASVYYSPYSLSSRITSARYSSPMSTPKWSPPPITSSRPISHRPLRPIPIDLSHIDISASQLPAIRQPNTKTAYGGPVHRGRTVIRVTIPNMATDNGPPNRRQKSPGRKLVEKFTIPERPRGYDNGDYTPLASDPPKIAYGGTIRRHLSPNRRKASLVTDEGLPVPSSRKSSISEELLKEEEAIFDSLIREEIARTNGIPERRNSFDCLPVDAMKRGRRKSKRYSVDIDATKGLETSESLSNFIEKLNADIARSPSTQLSPVPEQTIVESIGNEVDDLQPGVVAHTDDTANELAKTTSCDVKAKENGEQLEVEDCKNLKLKQKTSNILGEQLAVNSKLQKPSDDKSAARKHNIDEKSNVTSCQNYKNAAAVAAKQSNTKIDVKSTDVCNSSMINGPDGDKGGVAAKIKGNDTGSTKSSAAILKAESSNQVDKSLIKECPTVSLKEKSKVTKKNSAGKIEGVGQSPKKKVVKKNKKSSKSIKNVVDDNNNRISSKKSAKNRGTNGVMTQEENVEGKMEEENEAGKKRRKSINWKIVDVGRSDFDDDIADVNGWLPSEESSSDEFDYSSEESDSSDEEGRHIQFIALEQN